MQKVTIKTEFIKLDQFLKYTGMAENGGMAKAIILEGHVLVNGEKEERRGRKLFKGDKISLDDNHFVID